ncbi:MAG TPA: hypothetical protein PKJ99_14000 [Thermoanaerobaculales bacterium]|nr:hypothetical protein [Thermoanaerobaculales bacterium]
MRLAIGVTLVIIALLPSGATAQVPQVEREALIAFYYATGGPNWIDDDGWLGPVGTECNWLGVDCFTFFDNYVVGLYLESNNLNGYVPPQIADLGNLGTLQLSDNSVTSLPPEIGSLSELRSVYLDGNPITSLPAEFWTLGVTDLDLSRTQLGSLPAEIGQFTSLFSLYVEEMQLTALPETIGNLIHLYRLHAAGNNLASLPASIGDLASLYELDVSQNQLTALPLTIGQLQVLYELHLERNKILTLPHEIGDTTNLRRLYASHNRLSALPPEIGNLALYTLEVSSNRITTFPSEIADCPVSTLDVWWNGIYADDPALWGWLGQRQPNWEETQTVPPSSVSFSLITDHTLMMEWWPIEYVFVDGGFEVLVRESSASQWVTAGWTPDRYVTEFPVVGLTPGVAYDVAVRSFTPAHPNNSNDIISELSVPVTATTSTSGCEMPVISQSGGNPTTLTAPAGAAFYLWNTGETTQSILVQPVDPTWYWVTVYDGGCQESASVLVDGVTMFTDDFESGDTSAWSGTVP